MFEEMQSQRRAAALAASQFARAAIWQCLIVNALFLLVGLFGSFTPDAPALGHTMVGIVCAIVAGVFAFMASMVEQLALVATTEEERTRYWRDCYRLQLLGTISLIVSLICICVGAPLLLAALS